MRDMEADPQGTCPSTIQQHGLALICELSCLSNTRGQSFRAYSTRVSTLLLSCGNNYFFMLASLKRTCCRTIGSYFRNASLRGVRVGFFLVV